MANTPHPSGTRAGRKLAELCKRHYPWTCHLCGNSIPPVATPHPQSFEADHLDTAPHLRLVLTNLRPSHKICNQWRSNRPLTHGLLEEIKIKYATTYHQRRPALDFFNVGGHPNNGHQR